MQESRSGIIGLVFFFSKNILLRDGKKICLLVIIGKKSEDRSSFSVINLFV